MPIGEIEQRAPQVERRREQAEDELALPHPVHRHVDVVAAARRVQTARHVVAARGDDEAFDVEEQILVRAVVRDLPHVVLRDRVERGANRVGVGRRDDAAIGQHHQVCVVNRHQRREKQRLGVFEVLVEDVGDVFGGEAHRWEVYRDLEFDPIMRGMNVHRGRLLPILLALASAGAIVLAQSNPNEARAREIYKQLIEINTTDTPAGNVTTAAEAMAERLKAAGFPAADVQVIGPNARKFNLVARYRGTGARKPILLLAHLDVVEARREDWSTDPFAFLEKDGYFYGRGTSDDKSMAAGSWRI